MGLLCVTQKGACWRAYFKVELANQMHPSMSNDVTARPLNGFEVADLLFLITAFSSLFSIPFHLFKVSVLLFQTVIAVTCLLFDSN